MLQIQFLLALIAIVPVANFALNSLFLNKPILSEIISKTFPILFLASLFGASGGVGLGNEIEILKTTQNLSFKLSLDKISLKFLFLINFLWLIFTFYSNQFFKIVKTAYLDDFKLFFPLFIGLITLIIISGNLLSILFFYQLLIFLSIFFATKFLYKDNDKIAKIFNFIFYLQILFFFLAILLTNQFASSSDFVLGGVFSSNLTSFRSQLIFICYFLALFLPIIPPLYVLAFDFKNELNFTYIFFFLIYGIAGLIIFIKLFLYIFDAKMISLVFSEVSIILWELVFLFAISISSALLTIAGTIKKTFFYLFFQQLTFALFTSFLFIIFKPKIIYLPFLSFSLIFTLAFLTMSNLLIYLNESKNKTLQGLFYNLKITAILLIFALFSFVGISPSVALIEKISLLKIVFLHGLTLSKMIIFINFITLIIFAKKIIYPLIIGFETKVDSEDSDLANKIDTNSSLILTSLLVVIALILSLFSPFL